MAYLKAYMYQKTAKIIAEYVTKETEITTVLADGTVETNNVANIGDYIVTNPGGEKYVVPGDKFNKRYQLYEENENGMNVYVPLWNPQYFIQLNHDVEIETSWGEVQLIKEGGYLNITCPEDIYGVAKEEFEATYKIVDDAVKAMYRKII